MCCRPIYIRGIILAPKPRGGASQHNHENDLCLRVRALDVFQKALDERVVPTLLTAPFSILLYRDQTPSSCAWTALTRSPVPQESHTCTESARASNSVQ